VFGRRTYELLASNRPNASEVDEFRLMIDPVIVGGGKQAFHDDGVLRSRPLVEGQVTTTGAYLATYAVEERSSGAGPSRRWC